jgi:hypothetical protein
MACEHCQVDVKRDSSGNLEIETVRDMRDMLLSYTDWRDLPSYQGGDQEDWRVYRQELRDITIGYIPVVDIVWPTPPE